jgi:hypothetical protein
MISSPSIMPSISGHKNYSWCHLFEAIWITWFGEVWRNFVHSAAYTFPIFFNSLNPCQLQKQIYCTRYYIHILLIMHYFHDVHEINAYRADLICLSESPVCMIQFESSWMDLDEIWYGHYATESYPKIVLFNFLQSVITRLMNELVRWKQ